MPVPQWSIDNIRQLWSIYLSDIDPYLRIVDHRQVEDAISSYPQICVNRTAILLAIAFAVSSCKYPALLTKYYGHAKALEKALRCAKVSTRPSVLSLQALTTYLSCGRLHMDQDYLRTMLLMLVHVATTFRLNQDPQDLGYDTRECENRRRLWWHTITLDVRTAEVSGSQPLIISRDIEVKLPTMIRNIALQEYASIEWYDHVSCPCYSTMGFEMVRIARQILFGLAPNGQSICNHEQQQREQTDQLHSALLERYLTAPQCSDSPICRMTIQWWSIYWTRLKLLVSHGKRLFLREVIHVLGVDYESDLAECIGILERITNMRSNAEYARWAWLWQNCVEWDASAIALCLIATRKCSTETVNGAWILLDAFFRTWSSSNDFGDSEHRRRWNELLAFRNWVDFSSSASSFTDVNISDQVP